MRERRFAALMTTCTIAAALVTTPAAAEMRRLVGKVADASGKPLAKATVKLYDVGRAAPEYSADRSAVNASGDGAEPQRSGNALPWGQKNGALGADAKPLATITTDDKGGFIFTTPAYIGTLVVRIEEPGYASEDFALAFPSETITKSFALKEAGSATEAAAPASAPLVVSASDAKRADARFNEGVKLLKGGDFDGAHAAFAEVVKLEPLLQSAWLNLAIADMQRKDFQGALDAAESLLKLNPDHAIAKTIAGDARAGLGAKGGEGKAGKH